MDLTVLSTHTGMVPRPDTSDGDLITEIRSSASKRSKHLVRERSHIPTWGTTPIGETINIICLFLAETDDHSLRATRVVALDLLGPPEPSAGKLSEPLILERARDFERSVTNGATPVGTWKPTRQAFQALELHVEIGNSVSDSALTCLEFITPEKSLVPSMTAVNGIAFLPSDSPLHMDSLIR